MTICWRTIHTHTFWGLSHTVEAAIALLHNASERTPLLCPREKEEDTVFVRRFTPFGHLVLWVETQEKLSMSCSFLLSCISLRLLLLPFSQITNF